MMRHSSTVFRPTTRRVFGLLAPLAAALACSKPEPPPKRPSPVVVAVATRGPAPYLIDANGVVEPINAVSIQAQIGGVLTSVLFREGQDVQKGQLLFQIDPRQYESALRQAEAVLARDVAQAENARRDAERYAALVAKDYVTKSQADQAAATAVAQASLVAADQAQVEAAKLNLEYASIKAPISGRTGTLIVRAGNVVRAGGGDPLVVINQIQPIRVRFSVPERQLADVQKYAHGHALRVTATPSAGGIPAEGKLVFVDNGVDSTTGAVTLKAEFVNGDGRLWPGQFVAVEVELSVQPNAILVPAQAIMAGQNGSYVFVVGDSDKVAMKPVAVGRTVKDVVVVDSGLVAGARVVIDGQARLEPGSKVDIKPPLGEAKRGTP
ncbi:MAG: efflux RND transporter periplasmic adaptor subunit [Gemmatimonadota bacterium]